MDYNIRFFVVRSVGYFLKENKKRIGNKLNVISILYSVYAAFSISSLEYFISCIHSSSLTSTILKLYQRKFAFARTDVCYSIIFFVHFMYWRPILRTFNIAVDF